MQALTGITSRLDRVQSFLDDKIADTPLAVNEDDAAAKRKEEEAAEAAKRRRAATKIADAVKDEAVAEDVVGRRRALGELHGRKGGPGAPAEPRDLHVAAAAARVRVRARVQKRAAAARREAEVGGERALDLLEPLRAYLSAPLGAAEGAPELAVERLQEYGLSREDLFETMQDLTIARPGGAQDAPHLLLPDACGPVEARLLLAWMYTGATSSHSPAMNCHTRMMDWGRVRTPTLATDRLFPFRC